jgi:ATPase subunit of ABC transporter with duplicated ATPase domains
LEKAYSGPPVFEDIDFALERGRRLLIMGLNGAGKTSLLRILADEDTPTAGSFNLGVGVSVGYYAQEHEGIRAAESVLTHMRSASHDGVPDVQLRSLLGMFGLVGEVAFQDAATLSGGEKTKLALAQLVAGRHNLLLLDEPTNNLDPPSRQAIGQALASWPGAMVLVSHDTGFVSELAPHEVLLMPEGTLDRWDEDLLELVSMA